MIEITIPHIDVNGIARRGVLTPQLPRGKTNRIQVLRLLAEEMCVRVREDKDAVAANDQTLLASRIAGQASVAHGIYVPGADLLSQFEASRGLGVRSHEIAAEPRHGGYGSGSKRWDRPLRARCGLPAFDLLLRYQARLHQ